MKPLLILLTFILNQAIIAQKPAATAANPKTTNAYQKGYQYVMNADVYNPLKFTRSYTKTGDTYITTYRIFHPTTLKHVYTITAKHLKDERKVEVSIDDPYEGIFSHINDEETTYQEPSMEPFGFKGDVGILGGKKIPNQLMVRFTSSKYEHIQIMHVNGTESGSSNFHWFLLDGL